LAKWVYSVVLSHELLSMFTSVVISTVTQLLTCYCIVRTGVCQLAVAQCIG